VVRHAAVGVLLTLLACTRGPTAAAPRPLVIFHAAALGPPFTAIGDLLKREIPGLKLQPESSPSLVAVRKLTDLDRVPDVLATADVALFEEYVIPAKADSFIVFGTNALVLAYGPQSADTADLENDGWRQVLLRPGIRTGRSDPTVDPSGYRALMALQLAEAHYREPGLAARLLARMPAQYVRHAEADLSALVQAGELDYIWTYRNLARAHGLSYVDLPGAVNLGDPAQAAWYAQATVTLPGRTPADSLRLTGAPIVFAVTIPREAPHRETATAFVQLLLSARGRAVLAATGFDALPVPVVVRGEAVAP